MRRAAAWLVALILGTAVVPPASAQFSPGKLARAHAALDNPTSCLQCHAPRKSTTPDRCLACHTSLNARLTSGRGFHATIAAGKLPECGTCHADHGGPDAALISWPGGTKEKFDHGRTGFVLKAAHAKLKCEQCHKPDLVKADDVRNDHSLAVERTYMGLGTKCSQCHNDPHRGQFAAQMRSGDCAACHTEAGWKDMAFDHSKARFQLTGKHAPLQCAKCHFNLNNAGEKVPAGTAGSAVQYRPIEFSTCSACHTDPHRGQLGASCAQCHTTEDWKRIGRGTFDHSKARFPLEGRHATVECAKCHWPQNAAGERVAAGTPGATPHYKPLSFAACTECHKDPHKAQFGLDCNRCHSVAGWKVITPGAFDHDKTKYPLRGLHKPLACEKCHKNSDFKQDLAFDRCTACHRDAHNGELAKRQDQGACEACHTVDGFTPARYGAREHDTARFPLRDSHRAVACVACHKPVTVTATAGAKPVARLHFEDLACAACHRDPHAGQFAAKGAATDCARCHGTATWRLPKFDHSKTKFALDGAHAKTACAGCHRPVSAGDTTVVRYRPLDTACRSCHAEPVRRSGK